MVCYGLHVLPALRTPFPYQAVLANVAFTFVFLESFPVGGRIAQHFVLMPENAFVIFVVHIFIPGQVFLFDHRALADQRWDSSAVKDLLAVLDV